MQSGQMKIGILVSVYSIIALLCLNVYKFHKLHHQQISPKHYGQELIQGSSISLKDLPESIAVLNGFHF